MDSAAVRRRRVTIGSTSLVLVWDSARFHVLGRDGGLLDPRAAEVLIGLGGEPPAWLAVVDALHAVHHTYGGQEPVMRAAEALGQSKAAVARLAKVSDDPAVCTALAAAGHAQIAANPSCTKVEWDLLADSRDPNVAGRARALAVTLPAALADHPDPDVRARVARNPAVPEATLAALAADADIDVRRTVAANPSAPQAALATLAGSPDRSIAMAVAANRSTSEAVLRRLARHRHAEVRAASAANSSLPVRRATWMMWDEHGTVRTALAGRADLSPWALSMVERYALRDQQYRQTAWRLTNNPSSTTRLKRRIRNRPARRASGKSGKPHRKLRLRYTSPVLALLGGLFFMTLGIGGAVVGIHELIHSSATPQPGNLFRIPVFLFLSFRSFRDYRHLRRRKI